MAAAPLSESDAGSYLYGIVARHRAAPDAAALESGAVVPCRFCTVYRDEHDVRRFLAERADVLAAALARLDGCVELGVKAFAASTPGNAEATRAESGRAYLEARREEKQAREDLARSRAELVRDLHERLLAAAKDGVLLDLQSRDASGRDSEMVFNASYLVDVTSRFEAELTAAAGDYDGVQLEVTGPWPPYNFVPEELGRP